LSTPPITLPVSIELTPVSGATKRVAVNTWASEAEVELLLATGLDDAILGVVCQNDGTHAVLYDASTALACLRTNNPDWSDEECMEWFGHNVVGCLGTTYPAYLVYRAPLLARPAAPAQTH
jgi:hypothetical protein